jgi:hypothetical protein
MGIDADMQHYVLTCAADRLGYDDCMRRLGA